MTPFSKGDRVRLKANPERQGMIDRAFPSEDGVAPQYEVFFDATETRTYPESSLVAEAEFEAPDGPVGLLKQWRLADAEQFQSFLTLAKLNTPVADNLYSFQASRTELLPYQFKPVLKLIESPYSRMLIADEVGLGKTIEAGIVLTELGARMSLRKVLVVCPAALIGKWRNELRERFEWEFDVLDGASFRERVEEMGRSDEYLLRGIGSLELLRREENLEAIIDARPRFDVLIVDEAHHMRNSGTSSNFLGDALAQSTDTVMFLTATPLNLGERDFFELLQLLVPQEFNDYEIFQSLIEPNESINEALRILRREFPPDFGAAAGKLREIESGSQGGRFRRNSRYREVLSRLDRAASEQPSREFAVETQRKLTELNTLGHVFTRTRKREVSEHFPERRATKVPVPFTQQETDFYDAVTRWAEYVYGAKGGMPMGFVTVAFQRQAASCIPAMGAKLEEALDLRSVSFYDEELVDVEEELFGGGAAPRPLLPALDEIAGGTRDPDDRAEPARSTRSLDTTETQRLSEVARAWNAVRGTDSKYEAFEHQLTDLIESGARKVLVFAFFIRTIDYLEERLSQLTVNGEQVQVLKIYGQTRPDDRHSIINRFRVGDGPQILVSSEVGSEGLDFQFCSTMFNYDLPWNPMRVEQRIGRLDRYGQESELVEVFNMVVSDTIEDRIFYRLYERIGIFKRSIGDLEAILGEELGELQRDVLRGGLTPQEEERRANQIADAIIARQKDYEEFDEQSNKFLGVDDVFTERFNDIRKSERFITPEELRNFLEQFLARRFPKLSLRRIKPGEEGATAELYELTNSDDEEFIRFLWDSHYRDPHASRVQERLITHLQLGNQCTFTFDAHRAMIDRTLEFFTIHHPIVRAAVLDLASSEELLPTGSLRLDGKEAREVDAAPGRYLFFVYEIASKALRREIELAAAVVDQDGNLEQSLSECFLSAARQASSTSPASRWLIPNC